MPFHLIFNRISEVMNQKVTDIFFFFNHTQSFVIQQFPIKMSVSHTVLIIVQERDGGV